MSGRDGDNGLRIRAGACYGVDAVGHIIEVEPGSIFRRQEAYADETDVDAVATEMLEKIGDMLALVASGRHVGAYEAQKRIDEIEALKARAKAMMGLDG